MKNTKNRIPLILLLPTALTATVLSGCGNKAATGPVPYAGGKNPAAVPPAQSLTPAAAPATGGPPEAAAYAQKTTPSGKAPGAR